MNIMPCIQIGANPHSRAGKYAYGARHHMRAEGARLYERFVQIYQISSDIACAAYIHGACVRRYGGIKLYIYE
jgi:hypothetical protein